MKALQANQPAGDRVAQANPILALGVSPLGHIFLDDRPPAEEDVSPTVAARIRKAFATSQGSGLLHLGLTETNTVLPPILKYWRGFAATFVSRLCQADGLEERRDKIDIPFSFDDAEQMIGACPPMNGAEYVRVGLLAELWHAMLSAFRTDVRSWKDTVQAYVQDKNPAWNLVGKVCFHLAENRSHQSRPFAFLATYTVRLNEQAQPKHAPLGNALKEYAGAHNKTQLLALLSPIQKAAERSPLVKSLIDGGDIFHPLSWLSSEAYQFLKEIPQYEAAGIICRVPDWWRSRGKNQLQVNATIGDAVKGDFGAGSLMDFSVHLAMGDEKISPEEWDAIKKQQDGLALIRGRWVEIDRAKLDEVLTYWNQAQKLVRGGISFHESLRFLAGVPIGRDVREIPDNLQDWSRLVAGKKLAEILDGLRRPEGLPSVSTGDSLKAVLRPYQKTGVQWLFFLYNLGLGACLADDMGLGKTMQVLSLLLVLKRRAMNYDAGQKNLKTPSKIALLPDTLRESTSSVETPLHLLLVPASLIANWEAEIAAFAPELKVFIAHPSARTGSHITKISGKDLANTDLVITSYGFLHRLDWFEKMPWDLIILDEAQAIKNPGTKQTRAVKKLTGRHRLVLTGTPVENRLSDLWSLFDFLNPGLLGNAAEFARFLKQLQDKGQEPYSHLRNLIKPYVLRRMKTDKTIIADLPDKTEMNAYCALAKAQTVLYEESVRSLRHDLETMPLDNIQRRGLVLGYLIRFKQICNHPSHWLKDGGFEEADSGKFARLRELAETIAAKGEKALVFTQFQEMTGPLTLFLEKIFGRPGLTMHGQTPVKERKKLVERFQNDDLVPFFVLSLKVGGVGLNLTAANHVIHFDRWWNPAVENQATDRAFRIGQKRNVLVHKFVCRGTIEDKIDALLTAKQGMAKELLSEGAESTLLTEMSNEELIKLISLDLTHACGD